jgi:transcription elongation factor GreB
VQGPDGPATYEITGEDEADARLHRIAPYAPLARALIGARVGDTVTFARPAGNLSLTVIAIAHPAAE